MEIHKNLSGIVDTDIMHYLMRNPVLYQTPQFTDNRISLYCALRHQDDFSAGIIASVNHRGDSDSTGAVTGNILGALLGYHAIAPYSGTCFDLLRGEFDLIAEPRPIGTKKDSVPSGKATRLFTALIAAAERLLRVCKTMEGRPNKDLIRFEKEIEKLSDSMEK